MWRSTGDEKYLNAASSNLNYLMGCNPLGICYFTGYGTVSPEHPHHRPSIAQNKPMSGILVGGVHPYLEDSAAKAYCSGQPTGKCYVDNQQSFSTNEVTIYWNLPLTYLFTFIISQESIAGNINANGQFNAADVIMMQKYLIGDGDLIDWKAGDLSKDNVINIFDMILMKRNLL